MGILKFFVFVFFFIPWLSIRLVLKKEKGREALTEGEVHDALKSDQVKVGTKNGA
ncbi:MAG: hypothetical protein ETSY2_19910 [Candidatus Entotheonella gemina]|uniref:Uncharacterized protein n=1 Tax=Candidatus Entotheonella gemina TaxID=1429439 RepID=W4M6I8_9BACT|nr:MAG: hypothetical protein ETSY2_19910 [Candidatus Entotheonella gemina]